MSSLERKVARGATALDEITPNWYRMVDSWKLNLASVSDCVLGQIYGHQGYRHGLRLVRAHTGNVFNTSGRYGFASWNRSTNLRLRVLWIGELERRKEFDRLKYRQRALTKAIDQVNAERYAVSYLHPVPSRPTLRIVK